MSNLPAFFAVFALGTTFSFSLWNAMPLQTKAANIAAQQENDESLEIRLARVHLKLANLNLQHAIEANKRAPNVYSTQFIEKLRLHVAFDQAELERCLNEQDGDPHDVCIRGAESALRIAESNLKAACAVHEGMPTTNSAFDVARAKLVAEIATLDLESAKQLDKSDAVVTHLQRQIDQLRHQILELQMRR